MGAVDKAKNAAEELAGKVKEKVGDLTNNEDMKAEGKGDQAKSTVKQTGEDIKDKFKN